jgi:hypothetical protein
MSPPHLNIGGLGIRNKTRTSDEAGFYVLVRVGRCPFHAEANNVIFTVQDCEGRCNRTNEIFRLMKLTEENGSLDKSPYQNNNPASMRDLLFTWGLKALVSVCII